MNKNSKKEKKAYKSLKQKRKKLKKANELPTFNCHTHIFNFNYVHDQFLKGMFSIRFVFLIFALLSIITLLLLVLVQFVLGTCLCFNVCIATGVFCILAGICVLFLILFAFIRRPGITIRISCLRRFRILRILAKFFSKLLPGQYDILDRISNFIKHSYDINFRRVKCQEEILNELQSYYSSKTKFVVLTMDMDFMIDCKADATDVFYDQLMELSEIKEMQEYKYKIFPFIHADPRRLEKDSEYFKILKNYIKDKVFTGIKIYPALGYFPFDKRLKPVYDLALEYNLPIMTHCSVGPVFYRGKVKTLKMEPYYNHSDDEFKHPFTGKRLNGKTAKEFTPHFTHPLNYYCLMAKPDELAEYWNKGIAEKEKVTSDEVKKYRNLKICLAHFGASREWMKYLKDPWLPDNKLSLDQIFDEWNHEEYFKKKKDGKTYSWHTIIYDMLTLTDKDNKDNLFFPNLYSDISYNLSNEQMLPLLKVRLETNRKMAKKVLFGTDFFMVAIRGSEREISMKLRSFIGEEYFIQIAKLNPLRFLFSKVCDEGDLLGRE